MARPFAPDVNARQPHGNCRGCCEALCKLDCGQPSIVLGSNLHLVNCIESAKLHAIVNHSQVRPEAPRAVTPVITIVWLCTSGESIRTVDKGKFDWGVPRYSYRAGGIVRLASFVGLYSGLQIVKMVLQGGDFILKVRQGLLNAVVDRFSGYVRSGQGKYLCILVSNCIS